MASAKRGPSDPAVPPGTRRRRPPTIDLKATEIAAEPVEHVDLAQENRAAAAQSAPPPPPPRAEPIGPGPAPAAPQSAGLALASLRETMTRMASDLQAWMRDTMSWPLVRAGLAGAAVALGLALLVWGLGSGPVRDDAVGRLAALETQMRELGSRPVPVDQRVVSDLSARLGAAEQAIRQQGELAGRLGAAEQAVRQNSELATRAAAAEQARASTLEQRLAKIETAVAAPPPQSTIDPTFINRIAALEAAVRAFPDIAKRIDEAALAARDARTRADSAAEAAKNLPAQPAAPAFPRGEFDALAGRIAALERGARAMEERLAQTAPSAGVDRPVRLAFAAIALRGAVERGEPFGRELAAVKALAPSAALAPLEPFAANGVPGAAALARELSQLGTAMLNAASGTPQGGFMDRLQANAERLVRIRPINEAPGEDPAAIPTILARAEAKAAQRDLAGALAELNRLPEAARVPARAWIGRAEQQVAAVTAARRFAEGAVDALAKPGDP
jgi:hypothetical protein